MNRDDLTLRRAADIIERRGWTNGVIPGSSLYGMAIDAAGRPIHALEPGAVAFAMIGAIELAISNIYNSSVRFEFALTRALGESYQGWEQAAGRTKDEVVALLRRVVMT